MNNERGSGMTEEELAKWYMKADDEARRRESDEKELDEMTNRELDDYNEELSGFRGEGDQVRAKEIIEKAVGSGRYKLNEATGWLEWNHADNSYPESDNNLPS